MLAELPALQYLDGMDLRQPPAAPPQPSPLAPLPAAAPVKKKGGAGKAAAQAAAAAAAAPAAAPSGTAPCEASQGAPRSLALGSARRTALQDSTMRCKVSVLQ